MEEVRCLYEGCGEILSSGELFSKHNISRHLIFEVGTVLEVRWMVDSENVWWKCVVEKVKEGGFLQVATFFKKNML